MTTDYCDVLVHIALEEEFHHLLPNQIFNATDKVDSLSGQLRVHEGYFEDTSGKKRQVRTLLVQVIGDRSREAVVLAVLKYRPRYVFNIGISGLGVDDAKVGDLVLPSSFWVYDNEAKVTDLGEDRWEFASATKSIECDESFMNMVYNTLSQNSPLLSLDDFADHDLDNDDKKFIQQLRDENILANEPSIKKGAFAVGHFVASSKNFKQFLKTTNRKFVAIDMESAGVADALSMFSGESDKPQFLSIRAISDSAGDDKKKLDTIGRRQGRPGLLREWAMVNIGHALQVILPTLTYADRKAPAAGEESGGAGRVTSGRSGGNTASHQSIESFIRAEAPYLPIYRTSPNGDAAEEVGISEIADSMVQGDKSENIRHILFRAPGGCGKSALLKYFYLFFSRQDGLATILMDFSSTNNNKDMAVHFQTKLNELEAAGNRVAQITKLVVLFDDYPSRLLSMDQYRSICKACDKYEATMVFVENPDLGSLYTGVGPLTGRISFQEEYEIQHLTLDDKEKALKMITNFVREKPDEIFGKIEYLHFPYINPYIVTTVAQNKGKLMYRDLRSYIDYIEQSMKDMFDEVKGETRCTFEDICLEALKKYTGAKKMAMTDGESDGPSPRAKLYDRHFARYPRIVQWVLIGLAIINNKTSIYRDDKFFVKNSIDKDKFFNLQYGQEVSSIRKHMISTEERYLHQLFAIAEQARGKKNLYDYRLYAPLLYLLGRIESNSKNQERAKGYLMSINNKIKGLLDEEATKTLNRDKIGSDEYSKVLALRLARRAVYYGLAFYNEPQSASRYIELLVSEKQEDVINREYNRDYYKDINICNEVWYQESYGVNFAFEAEESQNFNWGKTRAFLLGYINSNANESQYKETFNIIMATYALFIRRRHEIGILSDDEWEEALPIFDKFKNSPSINDVGKTLLTCISRNLNQTTKSFSDLDFICDLYKLKALPRSGWLNLLKLDPKDLNESVAAHSFGTCLLAYLLVDKRNPTFAHIDIDLLVKILVFHDIGEFKMGDFLPNEKPEGKEQKEIDYIASMGLYAQLGDLNFIRDCFSAFENNKTSPEGAIAKEIDKLDAIIQAYCYRDKITDKNAYCDFVNDNARWINTEEFKKLIAPIFEHCQQMDKL